MTWRWLFRRYMAAVKANRRLAEENATLRAHNLILWQERLRGR